MSYMGNKHYFGLAALTSRPAKLNSILYTYPYLVHSSHWPIQQDIDICHLTGHSFHYSDSYMYLYNLIPRIQPRKHYHNIFLESNTDCVFKEL